MIILVLGTYRFWRQQNAMLRGKVHAGGWETNAVGILIVVVCIASETNSKVGDYTHLCAFDCSRHREKLMRTVSPVC